MAGFAGFYTTHKNTVAGNPREGKHFTLGLLPNGDVVHVYRDHERVVLHKPHADEPLHAHPIATGGTPLPHSIATGEPTAQSLLSQDEVTPHLVDLAKRLVAMHQNTQALHHEYRLSLGRP